MTILLISNTLLNPIYAFPTFSTLLPNILNPLPAAINNGPAIAILSINFTIASAFAFGILSSELLNLLSALAILSNKLPKS